MADRDYSVMAMGAADQPVPDQEEIYFDVGRLKRQYYDYFGVKSPEVEEQKQARRYYHGAQWTDKEIKSLRKRRQPVITSNRIVRKIDAVVGLVERLKQDPKAYPRNPQGQQGCDIATAVLRYALDHVDFNSKSPRVAAMAAIDGIAGIELDLAYGDHGDPDIDVHIVYTDTFFYDPRSYDPGFTDARYMGVSKWIDAEAAKELIPSQAEQIDQLVDTGTDLTIYSDREVTWINTQTRKIRLVDHWYVSKGQWMWAVYVGNFILMQGASPYVDERKRSFPKFLMFSAAVDHEGDRYGFVRNLKGPQDEINHRRSKALHILNSRRIISEKGAVDDVEKARTEWARPDGFLEINPGKKAVPDDQQADFAGQLSFLQEAKNEIENFGPNPALLGQGIESQSGRAIQLLQQAGIAELGPYILAYRSWKIRMYRAIWNIIQRNWTAERWIRVTDDQGIAQFIQINGLGLNQYGQPMIVNAVGSLDVDIILDEGPDSITMMGDVFEALKALIPAVAPMLQPAQAAAALGLLIDTAPLPQAAKDRFRQAGEQPPDPARQAAQQVALQGEQAKVQRTKAQTVRDLADATKKLHDAHVDQQQQNLDFAQAMGMGQPPPPPSPPLGSTQAAPAGPVPRPMPSGVGPVPGVMPSSGLPMMPQLPLGMPGPIPPGALAR